MLKSIIRPAAIFAALLPAALQAWGTPGQPTLAVVYEAEGERGIVAGTVTAPLTDMNSRALPDDQPLDIVVYRSAYSLQQSNLTVARFNNMLPGEAREFTDNLSPAWEFNQEYTYTAVVTSPGYEFYQGYARMVPGLEFLFPRDALTATPATDAKSVELTVVTPSTMADGQPIEVEIASMDFYRATDMSSWPYKYELIASIPQPEPGEAVSCTDTDPAMNTINYYKVQAVTQYGYTEAQASCYVGLDVPAAPYPVEARQVADGVEVSWTAPDRGQNWGAIDPAELWYDVYRCWGYGAANRELVATRISGTSFVDTGAGLEEPMAVRYEVQAGNPRGLGGSNYSSPDYNMVVGPAYALPFSETFDGGLGKVWTLTDGNYYTRWYEAREAEYGDRPVKTVKPAMGSGLIYADFVYMDPEPGTTLTMTSYKIALDGVDNPYVSFWYYAIPDNGVTISVAASEDPATFGEGKTFRIAEGVEKPEWRHVWVPLTDMAGKQTLYLRFTATYQGTPSSAIIDDITVMNYPQVTDLDGETDDEAMSATLTWSLPEYGAAECRGFLGYVDGVEYGKVESPWTYDGMELDRLYLFQVRPLYDDVEVATSPALGVIINTPAPTEFTVGDYDYGVITTDAESTDLMAFVQGYHGRGGLLRLPAQVSYKENVYRVIAVGDEAFVGNADVESVALPEGYTFLGSKAFAGMPALAAASIPASMMTIGDGAFANCPSLSTVSFAGQAPPSIGEDAFTGVAPGCKGLCPEGSEEAYAKTAGLEALDFGYIDDSGLRFLLDRENVRAEWFDLTGRPASAAPGEPRIVRLTLPDGTIRVVKTL